MVLSLIMAFKKTPTDSSNLDVYHVVNYRNTIAALGLGNAPLIKTTIASNTANSVISGRELEVEQID